MAQPLLSGVLSSDTSGQVIGPLPSFSISNSSETGDKGRLFAGTSGAASVERRVE